MSGVTVLFFHPASIIKDLVGEEKITSAPACEIINSLFTEARALGCNVSPLLIPWPPPYHSVSQSQTGSSYHPEPFLTGSCYDTGSKAVALSAVSSGPWGVWIHQSTVLLYRKCRGVAGHSVCWSIVYLLVMGCTSLFPGYIWSSWVALCASLGKAGITKLESPRHAYVSFISSSHIQYTGLTVIIPFWFILKSRTCCSLQAKYSLHVAACCRPLRGLFMVLWPHHKLRFDVVPI